MKEKTKQFILYFIKENPKSSITSLMKLFYLSDLIANKRVGRQISDFEYKRWHFGPFDKNIYRYIESFMKDGIVKSESDYGVTGEEFNVFFVNNKEKEINFDKLKEEEIEIIDELIETMKGYGAKILTDIAYKTEPMKKIGAKLGNEKGMGEILDLTA